MTLLFLLQMAQLLYKTGSIILFRVKHIVLLCLESQ